MCIFLIFFLGSFPVFEQNSDYQTIEKAIKSRDVEIIVSYVPDEKFGQVTFGSPDYPMNRLSKEEFRNRITEYFKGLSTHNYEQIFNDKIQSLPLIVGRLSTQDKKEYIMISLASFGGSYKFLSFQITDRLPDNLKNLE